VTHPRAGWYLTGGLRGHILPTRHWFVRGSWMTLCGLYVQGKFTDTMSSSAASRKRRCVACVDARNAERQR
jgi:hypothetical protein